MDNSPLPDASALEAGIIEDDPPSRLSRVQDNVRNLLRNSRLLVSLHSSPTTTNQPDPEDITTTTPPAESPTGHPQARTIPSPTPTPTPPRLPTHEAATHEVPPPSTYQRAVHEMAHQSTWFNNRAVAALINHPDLTDPSLARHLQQQQQEQKTEKRKPRAWKRSRHHGRKRGVGVAVELGSSQVLLCIFSALLLAAVVATYVVLATTSSNITPTFHILFILGIILATIVFAHSMLRLLFFSRGRRSKLDNETRKAIVLPSRHKHHRRRRGRHHHRRERNEPGHRRNPNPSEEADETADCFITRAYIPPSPIPIHMPSDENEAAAEEVQEVQEVRPDSREAQPTTTLNLEQQRELSGGRNSWDDKVNAVPNPPPPAYGRWRGSVRVDPELLHWRAAGVTSPAAEGGAGPTTPTPGLASPRYEEVVGVGVGIGVVRETEQEQERELTRPPSYVTRDSPARRRGGEGDGRHEGDGVADDDENWRARVVDVVEEEPECEMVEVRAVGLAV